MKQFTFLILLVLLISFICSPVLASDVEGTVAAATVPDASDLTQTIVDENVTNENVDLLEQLVELQALESGFLLFLCVVVLFYFGYKFFRMFF